MSARFADATLADFAAKLADKVPSPGGGAVAAVTLAHGAALAAMVLRYSVGRPAHVAHESANIGTLAEFDAMRSSALALADRDAAAYARLAALWKLPPGDANRVRDFPAALQEAIEAPQAIVDLADRACALLSALPARTNPRLGSDLAIAANLCALAADAAAWNVRVNLSSLADPARAREHQAQLQSQVARAHERAAAAVAEVQAKAG